MGNCSCEVRYSSANCDKCDENYINYPNCIPLAEAICNKENARTALPYPIVVGVGMASVSLAIRTDYLIIHVSHHWVTGNMPSVQVLLNLDEVNSNWIE
jgi:hypothetical protein